MDDRFNTMAGWALFSGIVALGLASVSNRYFGADFNERPEKMGFEIAGVVSSSEGGEEVPLATLLASADLAKGESTFKKCASCHTINQGGASGIGPNVFAIMGQPIGKHVAGFAYSPALSGHGGNWDFDNMDAWLKSPRKFAEGTKMSFAGLADPAERANLIAYLNSQGSNLPLPAAPAAAEAPAADAAEGDAAAAPEAGASDAAAPAATEAAPAAK